MRLFVSKFLMFLLFLLMLIQPVEASQRPLIVDDAEVCTIAAQQMEKKYQIKKHLLSTITSVETGRWSKKHQRNMAWPWTVNAQGKGRFFETKREAIAEVKRLQAEGVKSIDVGCMQVNLAYHPDAFKNLEDAFNPYKNMEYGAKFLKDLYAQKGNDWNKAATAYHSSLPEKAEVYAMKLSEAYKGIIQASLDKKPVRKTASKIKNFEKKRYLASARQELRDGVAQRARAAKEQRKAVALQERKQLDMRRNQEKIAIKEARKLSAAESFKKATAWREAKLSAYQEQKLQRQL